jgi:hypothetical protein
MKLMAPFGSINPIKYSRYPYINYYYVLIPVFISGFFFDFRVVNFNSRYANKLTTL